jgi:hypothetical protein
MAHCHCLLFLYNTTIEEDDGKCVVVFFFLNTKKTKHTRKQQKKKPRERRELTFKLLLCLLTFGPHFYPFISSTFSSHLFSSQAKEKKRKEKMNHREEKECRERRELSFKLPLYPFSFGSCFCFPSFAFLFQTLSLGIFFFSSKRKEKKTKKKKFIKKKKNVDNRGSFPSSSCYAFSFLVLTSTLLFQTFFPKIFFFSSRRKKNP